MQFQLAESEKVAAMTKTFQKFVPEQFLTRIAKEGWENIELGKAETDVITILFSDIRGFTSFSEKLTPQELLNFLNAYLHRMNEPIHAHHGFVDKFIGDAIMALFDRPDATNNAEAQDAVEAAIAMQEGLTAYNVGRARAGYVPIVSGIGIHSGEVIIGTVGSADRLSSTVLGDNVNLASRIEALTKLYGVGILITHDTFLFLEDPHQFKHRELDCIKVKGKSTAVNIYEIYDADPPEIQEKKRKTAPHLVRGLQYRQTQNWDKALMAFQKALEHFPEELATQRQIEICKHLQANPPGPDWDGALQLDEK